jgi:hypothetical protein
VRDESNADVRTFLDYVQYGLSTSAKAKQNTLLYGLNPIFEWVEFLEITFSKPIEVVARAPFSRFDQTTHLTRQTPLKS